jgi:hypothetical protein
VGLPYTAWLAATGGTSSYTWSLRAGSLPAGLALDTSTGTIAGAPSAAGTYTFTVVVADAGPPAQQTTAALSITIAPGAQSVTASVGDQSITLAAQASSPCLARSDGLTVSLASTKVTGSPQLRFRSARLYIDKGSKLTRIVRVRGKNGHKRTVRLITYVANATLGRLPATVRLSLTGYRGGSHTVSATLSYSRKVRRHGHQLTLTVTKTLAVNLTVC